jgi:hypothetical protein
VSVRRALVGPESQAAPASKTPGRSAWGRPIAGLHRPLASPEAAETSFIKHFAACQARFGAPQRVKGAAEALSQRWWTVNTEKVPILAPKPICSSRDGRCMGAIDNLQDLGHRTMCVMRSQILNENPASEQT